VKGWKFSGRAHTSACEEWRDANFSWTSLFSPLTTGACSRQDGLISGSESKTCSRRRENAAAQYVNWDVHRPCEQHTRTSRTRQPDASENCTRRTSQMPEGSGGREVTPGSAVVLRLPEPIWGSNDCPRAGDANDQGEHHSKLAHGMSFSFHLDRLIGFIGTRNTSLDHLVGAREH
jgi:hypothetical protein